MVQDVVYGVSHDVSLKTGIKNRKAPKEIMEYLPLKEAMDEISSALDEEKKESAAPVTEVAEDVTVAEHDKKGSGSSDVANTGSTRAGLTTEVDTVDSPVLCGLPEEKRAYWAAMALRTVRAHVQLITEPDTASGLTQLISKSSVGELQGTDRQDCILILFDPKQSGEAMTQPHVRTAPLNTDQLFKLVSGVLESRKQLQPTATTIIDGDVVCMLDGARHGAPWQVTVRHCCLYVPQAS